LQKSMTLLQKRRKVGKYVRKLKHQPHNIRIDVDAKSKLKALHFHKSQFGDGGPFVDLSAEIENDFLNHEYFLS